MSLPTSAFSTPDLSTQRSFVYNDVQGLQNIKRLAEQDEDAALKQVALQFESMFMQLIMKSMRDATRSLNEDSFLNTQYTEFYQEMHDEQLIQEMSRQGGLGLGEMLYQQLSKNPDRPNGNSVPDLLPLDNTGRPILPSHIGRPRPEREDDLSGRSSTDDLSVTGAVGSGQVDTADKRPEFTTPDQFVNTLWPLAEEAAEALDADPRYILAQAALETGWGQHVIGQRSGDSSYNLFNIKADQRWSGDSARVTTREYLQGRPVNVEADFRAYESFSESFSDYVAFLQNSPRYADALAVAQDGESWVTALQDAGYATDPAYADKINRIANSPWMQGQMASSRPVAEAGQ
ncbi:MAG: flagellar assembly peptidoglycan hydrolase FlgJ [Natronospirillum sp.]|uniref:flagellar assembly peptidoglycan hydrolase FlgJ n=1 Tax=Natronospirillum sp. TaxID=2812955 RepID=UPI0025D9B8F2|nr:flagellar assembly peptidoglycan hydrolase FlgJ [Natronospirillum sp.]MCH8553133.1 flagellar assembly peptidoglycan hydrolase FlgJ [Natronospirillum sp.]